jgi:5-methylcytosine-specific restriction enzyme A
VVARDPRYQSPEWKRLRILILDRDRWACQVRGRGCTHGASSVDHIVASAEGGDFWDPANLRASCRPCNSTRGSKLATSRAARYRTSVARYVSRF